jgi:hypothetical protein
MMIEVFIAAAAWGSLLFMLAAVTAHVNGYEKALGPCILSVPGNRRRNHVGKQQVSHSRWHFLSH